MPVYDFESPDGKIISVLVTLKEPDHLRQVQVVDGVTYKRVYSAPTAGKDLRPNDATQDDFQRMTTGKNLKVGEMWEIAKEMSAARQDRQGIDPVKEKFYKDYKKQNKADHPDVVKRQQEEKNKKVLEEYGIKVS